MVSLDGGYLVTSTANPGESFYSVDGQTWSDLYYEQTDHSANFCIKALTMPEAGDSNNDHVVDGLDLAIWQQHYDPVGKNLNTFEMGDWNLDGLINGTDLAIWQQNYRPVNGLLTTAEMDLLDLTGYETPEPGTLMLMGVGLVWLVRWRRLL